MQGRASASRHRLRKRRRQLQPGPAKRQTRRGPQDPEQAGRRLASQVYAVSARGKFARDFALRDQIRRATISMMADVAEGFARKSGREFAHFLFTGKGSAAEAQSHLYVALDLGYIDDSSFRHLFSQ